MLGKNTTDRLLAKIREGQALSTKERLNLIVELSIPSILAQITSILMFSSVYSFRLLDAASTESAIMRMACSRVNGFGPG